MAFRIMVDFRERNDGITRLLMERYNFQVVRAHLAAGDYIIDYKIGVERKTCEDFLRSIVDGRLFRQAKLMRQCFMSGALIIEGDGLDKAAEVVRVHPHAVAGALVSISLQWQVPVLFAAGEEQTALLLSLIARQEEEIIHESSFRHGRRPRRLFNRQAYVLQGLPGVGPKLARELLIRFGNIEQAVCASEGMLMQVPGIGRRKAERIREIITSPHATSATS